MKAGSVRSDPFASCDQLYGCVAEAVPPQELLMTTAERLAVRQLLAALTAEGVVYARNDLRD